MRKNPITGELTAYYRIVESYRDSNGAVRHRTLLTVGFVEDLDPRQLSLVQKGLNECFRGIFTGLFPEFEDEKVNSYIKKFYGQIAKRNKLDAGQDWQTVDMNTLKNRDVREVGAEWLCMQAVKQLGVGNYLKDKGWTEEQVSLALTHLISRTVYPASEYKTSRWIAENSAVCEITGYNMQKITKDKLYQISHALYGQKSGLEAYLSRCTNELFDLQDKIFLYDLTNTYFEGEKRSSGLAKFGKSKEKRNDARLVVLAMVVNPEGFIKYSAIYEGNKADCKTVPDMIEQLRKATASVESRALVIMDAGIATDENLRRIIEKGYDYLCVTRARLKDYTHVSAEDQSVYVYDKKEQKIELCRVHTEKDTDYYLKIKSQAKAKKESGMNSRFTDRFEEGMKSIRAGLSKKGGTKRLDKVHQRIGRLKQKYPSVQRFYQIDVSSNNKNIVTAISWNLKQKTEMKSNEGVYFLRTSLKDAGEETVWKFYNIIREIEATFRTLKTDLDLRPIYHKTDDASKAHLHLGLLAYWIVNTVRFQLKQKGIHHDWREILRIMNTQKCVTTSVVNKRAETIHVRKCSEPGLKAKAIYDALKYKYLPFVRKKFVVPKSEQKNHDPPDAEFLMRA